MSAKPKKRLPMLTVRMKPRLRAEFHVAVELMHSNAANVVRRLILETVDKQRQRDPRAFEDAVQVKLAEMERPRKTTIKLVPGPRQKANSAKS